MKTQTTAAHILAWLGVSEDDIKPERLEEMKGFLEKPIVASHPFVGVRPVNNNQVVHITGWEVSDEREGLTLLTQAKPLTEEQEAEAGKRLAAALHLRRDNEHADRWQTGWGSKTNLGLYRTIKSMVMRAEEGRGNEI